MYSLFAYELFVYELFAYEVFVYEIFVCEMFVNETSTAMGKIKKLGLKLTSISISGDSANAVPH